MSQDNLFGNICIFGACLVWQSGRRAVSSYLDVDTIKYQYRLSNTTPLDFSMGYIMQDYVGDRDLKKLYYQSLDLINGSISGYWYVLYCAKLLDMINQLNKLADVIRGIESCFLGGKWYTKKRDLVAKYISKKKE